MTGTLYLIPTNLSEAELNRALPSYNFDIIRELKHFIVEDIRSARRFLKKVDKSINIDELQFFELNEHSDLTTIAPFLKPIEEGYNMGVISEAGCPCIADPGADIVAIAQRKNYKVVPLVGPSSILLSLMGSGFNGQSFAFNGYLPIEKADRINKIRALERRCYDENQSQIFIETPYRNAQLLDCLVHTLRENSRLCVACDITGPNEKIVTKTIREWKKSVDVDIQKKPCIFLIYK